MRRGVETGALIGFALFIVSAALMVWLLYGVINSLIWWN